MYLSFKMLKFRNWLDSHWPKRALRPLSLTLLATLLLLSLSINSNCYIHFWVTAYSLPDLHVKRQNKEIFILEIGIPIKMKFELAQ